MPRNAPSAKSRASATLRRRRPSVMMIGSLAHTIGHTTPAAISVYRMEHPCAENSEPGARVMDGTKTASTFESDAPQSTDGSDFAKTALRGCFDRQFVQAYESWLLCVPSS